MKTRSSAFCVLLPLATLLPKYPSSHRHSDTQTNAPNSFLSHWTLIPLLFTPHASPPRLPASLCSALCSALYSVVSFFLFFFFFLSFVFFNAILIFFFFFNFCLIWSEEYVLKVEICYQNTKQHWSATTKHQVPTNSEAFIFINFFFFYRVWEKNFQILHASVFFSFSSLWFVFSQPRNRLIGIVFVDWNFTWLELVFLFSR